VWDGWVWGCDRGCVESECVTPHVVSAPMAFLQTHISIHESFLLEQRERRARFSQLQHIFKTTPLISGYKGRTVMLHGQLIQTALGALRVMSSMNINPGGVLESLTISI